MHFAWLLVAMVLLLAPAGCYHGERSPEPPSCIAAADHVRSLFDPATPHVQPIHDAFATSCLRDGWSAEARSCVVATTSLRRPRGCKALLTDEQRRALDHALAVATPRTAGRLPSVCRQYGDLVDRLAACALPETMRGPLSLAYQELAQAWRRGSLDAEATEIQCRAMLDGLRQVVAARCGW